MAQRKTGVDDDGAAEPGAAKALRYRAPALEKGLEILELLARESRPLATPGISERLGRSPSELFRMILVLEHHGYIEQSPDGTGFVSTDKLFTLAMERAPVRNLLEVALPRMRELAQIVGQSCHLAVRSGGDIVVVARIESPEQIGFTVRIGYRRSFIATGSGTILYAFMPDRDRQLWLERLPADTAPGDVDRFVKRAALAQVQGYERIKSTYTDGITDICAPVLRGPVAAASLAIPFVHSSTLRMAIEPTIGHLRDTAAEISALLVGADHRV